MKKTIIFALCILSLLSLALTGCSDQSAPEGFQNAASENEAFYLYVPKTWSLNTSGGTSSAYFSTSDTSNISMTCMVIEPGTMDELEEYKSVALTELAAVLPNFKEVTSTAENTHAKLGDRDAVSFEYECKLGDDTYKYMQVVTLKNDMFYVLTYTALEENYETHLEDLNAVIGYVKFK